MIDSRKIKIRPVPGMNCWCAMYIDSDGYETRLIATGFGLRELIKLLPPAKEIVVYPIDSIMEAHQEFSATKRAIERIKYLVATLKAAVR